MSSIKNLVNHVLCGIIALCLLMASGVLRAAPTLPQPSEPSAFAQRNSPAAIARLAQQLAAMLNAQARGMQPFNQAMHAGQYTAALEAFKQLLFNQMRYINPQSTVLIRWSSSTWLPGPTNASPARRAAILQRADALLHGKIIIKNTPLDIGPPGAVNWRRYEGAMTSWHKTYSHDFPWHSAAFDPLISAYIFTGEQKYLKTWSAYVDDWAINQADDISVIRPELVGDVLSRGPGRLLAFVQLLHFVAVATPDEGKAMPAATVARVVVSMFKNILPNAMVYYRSCPQNWALGLSSKFIAIAGYYDMFQASNACMRLGRRVMETWNTIQDFPDGTENQRDNGYNYAYPDAQQVFMSVLKDQDLHPAWLTVDWRKELTRNVAQRCRFLLHCLTQNGEDPAGVRADKRNRAKACLLLPPAVSLLTAVPSVFYEPTIQRLLNVYFPTRDVKTFLTAVSSQRQARGNDHIADKPDPSYRSEWFPYAGYYLLRNGWKQDDALMFMLSTNNLGKDFRTVTDNNLVTLRDFGQDLVVSTQTGAYGYNNAPIAVDGHDEFSHAGMPRWGHRGYLISVRRDPPSRCYWLSSQHFDVAEGTYSGPFGALAKWPGAGSGTGNLSDELRWNKALVLADKKAIRGVHFTRWIEAPQGEGLYIITDRLNSTQAHAYSQVWPLPIGPSRYPVFSGGDIMVHQGGQSIQTQCPLGANLSIYNFGQPVKYVKVIHIIHKSKGKRDYSHRLYNLCMMHADWKNQGGNSLLITVLDPRRTMADGIPSIKSLSPGHGQAGFTAHLKDGDTMDYLAAPGQPQELMLGNITADAKSLLLETHATGNQYGVVLGCTHLAMGGVAEHFPRSDFEFAIRNGTFTVRDPIYRPILPVKILPGNTNGFVGSQKISLSCATADVQIRYTLDGSNPDTHSPLYTAPFTIDRSVQVQARAFRHGVSKMPVTQTGTEVTDVSSANFTRLDLEPALPLKKLPQAGLHYTYYTGSWQNVFLFDYLLKPAAKGTVPTLFDLHVRTGPPGPNAFRYTGYFDAPADGAYTFYAPHELVSTTVMAGYVLRIHVDGVRWYPATGRHAFGSWTIGLKKGLHAIRIYWGDYRTPGLAAQLDNPGLTAPCVWNGVKPDLEISGPGLKKQPIPQAWLRQ